MAQEELRLALVMNGGVSLAVWIGGATAELWRLVTARPKAQHPVYQGLLELTDTTARVDVISGTSAGGINGAALALALLHDSDFMELRRVWTEVGDFQALLRHPLDIKNPGSILKGDAYFLPEIQEAFEQLSMGGRAPRHTPEELPLDLKLTTTLLSGAQGRNVDDLGEDLHDVDYRAYFHFRHRPGEDDDFEAEGVIARLARAARSTASFPFAFEPSQVGPTHDSRLRTYQHDDMKQTRFVIDGGVLDNKPFRGARDAIFDMPHNTKVRRVMAYLNPDPGDGPPFDFGKEQQAPPPAMSSVVAAAVIGIPTSQTIADQLLEIRKHNEDVRARRSNVQTLASAMSHQPEQLLMLAAQLYPSYRKRRLATTFELFVFEPLTLAASREPRYAQVMKRFGRNTRDALRRQFIATEGDGWLPASFEPSNPVGSRGKWPWGMFPVEFAITVTMNLLRLVQAVNERVHRNLPAVEDEWKTIFACIRRVHAQRREETAEWRTVVKARLDELAPEALNPPAPADDVDIMAWHRRLVGDLFAVTRGAARQATCEELAHQAAQVCRNAARKADELWAFVQANAHDETVVGSDLLSEAQAMHDLSQLLNLPVADSCSSAHATLSVLLSMEVVEFAFTDHQEMRSDTLIELVQISGNDASPLGGSRVAAQKLRGIQVGHFGAFYKRSWRANDWTFGRLDSSSRIVDILLNPACLWTGFENNSPKVFERLKSMALAQDLPVDGRNNQLKEQLEADWALEACEETLVRELSFLDAGSSHLPDALPQCARALKRRLHYEIAMEEMGHIAAAVESDQSNGALASGAGHTLMCRLHRIRALADVERSFVAETFKHLNKVPPIVSSPQAARDLISSGLLAQESFHTEVGSDLLTQTFAHTMATVQSTLAAKSARLGPVASFFRALHLPVFGFYMAATSLAKQSATAAAVIALLLGVGVTLVTVSVASSLPEVVGTLGWTALCAGVLMACAASKRTALWILVPLLMCMGAFAVSFEHPPLWLWMAVFVMGLALLNRLQFPVALIAILCAGLYVHRKSSAEGMDFPILALTAVVVLALVVAYVHGTTRRKRDWHAVLVRTLRTQTVPGDKHSQGTDEGGGTCPQSQGTSPPPR